MRRSSALLAPARRLPTAPSLAGQLAVFAGLIGTIALAPPAEGPMLLVPLLPGHAGSVAALNLALGSGATLLAAGPLSGSLIVRGNRARLLGPLLASGTLVLAAMPPICGEQPESNGEAA